MRSLIIIEVEHGENTDDLEAFADYITSGITGHKVVTNDYTIRVDLPACFELGG